MFPWDGWTDWDDIGSQAEPLRVKHLCSIPVIQWFDDPNNCLDLCLQSDGTRFKLVTTPATTPQFWVLWIHQKTGYHGYHVIRRQWLGSSGRTRSRCIQLNSLRLPTLRRKLWLVMGASKMWHWNIPFFLRENMFFIHPYSSSIWWRLMLFNIQLHLIKATLTFHAARKRCKLAVMAAKKCLAAHFWGSQKSMENDPEMVGECWLLGCLFYSSFLCVSFIAPSNYLLVLKVGNGWVAGGCWDYYY